MLAAIVLGFVQGLTEFLPVSSSGHLIILPWFFRWSGTVDSLPFDVALHGGTLTAVIFYFAGDVFRLLRDDRRTVLMIILATVPAGVAGLVLEDLVSGSFRSPFLVAAMLAIFGLVMWLSERGVHWKTLPELGMRDAAIIGLAQALAIVPGVSRSGVTIAAALFSGYRREEAARFSFLLSIPVIGGATVLEARHLRGMPSGDLLLVATGFITAALAGYGAIGFLMGFLKKHSLDAFVYYRWLVALAVTVGTWYLA